MKKCETHAKAKGTKSGKAIGRPAVSPAIDDRIRDLRAEGLGMPRTAHAGARTGPSKLKAGSTRRCCKGC